MGQLITLKQLCEEVGVTRRRIQCYEEMGVMHSVSRNKYGYLLYDEKMLERAKLIKFYQDIGIGLSEIAELLEAPSNVLIEVINQKIECLQNDMVKTQHLIEQAQVVIKTLSEKNGCN